MLAPQFFARRLKRLVAAVQLAYARARAFQLLILVGRRALAGGAFAHQGLEVPVFAFHRLARVGDDAPKGRAAPLQIFFLASRLGQGFAGAGKRRRQ